MPNLHRLIFFVPLPTPCALKQQHKEKATVPTAETELLPFHIHTELVFPVTEKKCGI